MTRNLSDKPHQTPHPDQPHAMGPGKDRKPAPARSPTDESESDEPTYDSCVDDLNLLLAASINKPDPNLESAAAPDAASPAAPTDQSVTGFASDRGREPRTSEVFQAVGPFVGDVPPSMPDRDGRSQSGVASDSPEALHRVEPASDRALATGHSHEGPANVSGETDSDDQPDRVPVPWTHLLLLSYSSALTLGLIWAIWQGRLQRFPVPYSTDSSSNAIDATTNVKARKPAVTTPPLPTENLTTLGQTIQVGELEVTPLTVMIAPLTLVRTIEPSTERRSDGSSLVLRLRLMNISKDHTFAPLEPGFLRDPISPLDRPYIETANGDTISLFPLANDSEWSIRGEEFPALKPGERVETIIGSEATAPDALSGEMTWRVRLRVGSYRTEMLGVRFTKDDVLSAVE